MALSTHGARAARWGVMTSSTRSFAAPQFAVPVARSRTVEVFADVRCPFAYVGLLRFVEKRHEVGARDVSLVVRAWPLELVNGAPLDAGLISQKVRALRDQVAPDLCRGFDERAFPATSMPALRLEAWARRQSADAGERVSLALRVAMFEHGRDIADVGVLREIAASCGVDEPVPVSDNDVIESWLAGKERGVVGSPHFFAAEGNWFCPSLTITHADGGLRMADNRDGLDWFEGICLGGADPR